MIKNIVGVLCIIAGILLGLYVGVYLMLVGGIVQFIEAAKAEPVDATGIAWGAVRVMFAALTGALTAFMCFFIGGSFFDASERDFDRKLRASNHRARNLPRRTGLR